MIGDVLRDACYMLAQQVVQLAGVLNQVLRLWPEIPGVANGAAKIIGWNSI